MRALGCLTAALLALCCASPALAQDAPVDTISAWRYYPLDVGNEWVTYANDVYVSTRNLLERTKIESDSLVQGVRYVVQSSSFYQLDVPGSTWREQGRNLLRYDSSSTDVRFLNEDGTEGVYHCNLSAPEGSDPGCGGPVDGYRVETGIDVWIGGQRYPADAQKTPSYDFPFDGAIGSLVAGIGPYINSCSSILSCYKTEFVRVAGVEYGRRPVATDAPIRSASLSVTAGPSPTSDRFTVWVQTTEPARATIDVFDAVGRRVWQGETSSGHLPVDGTAWAPGLYLVRVTWGGQAAATRVVRR